MTYRLQLVTAPKDEPVTLDEAMAHCRVDGTDDGSLLQGLIKTARELAETYTRRAFITQTLALYADAFPSGFIELPRPPLISVTHVKSYTDADVSATLAASSYYVDTVSAPGRLVLRDTASWPDVARVANGVEVQYIAGYGAQDAVPSSIKTGVLQLVSWLYEHRGDASMIPPDSAYASLVGDRIWLV